jgi:uncharacterized protein YndB with AHSA1/START domain
VRKANYEEYQKLKMTQVVDRLVMIKAPVGAVWETLTTPALMKQWMGEDLGIEVITSWQPGDPIVIKGFHHIPFENKGTILQFEPNKVLAYNYISSLSRLDDKPENYSIIGFTLTPQGNQTSLSVAITNFPTETIFKHVEFYWRGTIEILRKLIEERYTS